MKKRTYLHSRPWPGVMACGFSLFGGLSSASAAVIAQTFAVPLAPNTLNWGPDVKAGLEYQKRVLSYAMADRPIGRRP